MLIGYVCTNYNNSDYSYGAVKSLLASGSHDYRIVVVDNASATAEVDKLKKLSRDFPTVEVIFNPRNEGYFGGLNVGIRRLRATAPDAEWMVVGNNDLEFPADFGDRLAANAARLREHAVISPDVVTLDGEHQNPHVISTISRIREVFYDLYYSNYYLGMLIQKVAMTFRGVSDRSDEQQWRQARPIYQGHGSCYLLGPRFFDQFDALWAPTLMMSEEYFLSKQLSDVGQQVYYDPCIQIVHHCHASLSTLPGRRRWQMARDAHREYRKYVKVFG